MSRRAGGLDAVSYTHLIYLLEDLLRFIKKNGFDALGKLHGVGKRSCEDLYPVSYTHLDVYKRQVLGRAANIHACSELRFISFML